MDNMNVYGEVTENTSTGSRKRYKAFETLNKIDESKIQSNDRNKENYRMSDILDETASEESDYVPYRLPNTINISDLVTDETINLENSSFVSYQESEDSNVSFKPADLVGYSTLNKRDQPRIHNLGSSLSVADILASSFSQKARDLSDNVRSGDIAIAGLDRPTGVRRAGSMTSMNSLPRTSDMSHSIFSNSELSLIGGDGLSFGRVQSEETQNDEETFEPGELMLNKLILDEIAWAEEFAAIPATTLSNQAKQSANRDAIMTSNPFDSSQYTSSLDGYPNLSIGTYFKMRSDNVSDMINSKIPDKLREPVALVEDEDSRSSIANATSKHQFKYGSAMNVDVDVTPAVDNKMYTKVPNQTVKRSSIESDKRYDTQNVYQLSLSAIDRAMCSINIETDNSKIGLIQQVLSKAKPRSSSLHLDETARRGISMSTIPDELAENIKNSAADVLRNATLSDKMDCTDSLLNSNETKELQGRNTSQSRSPLSPLNSLKPLPASSNDYCSPGCRYLNAGAVHKTNFSSGYGVPPTRTYSSTSQRSTTASGHSDFHCSNSSEFSQRDAKIIPLKVTTLELSWGSTKLRTDARKTMQVKNISSKRLVVRMAVYGPGYQIVNLQSNSFTIQSQECRSIIISLCPTITGIAIGALCFYLPLGSTAINTPVVEISLYGYGGHAAIVPLNMLKGPIGASFMPMGDVCEMAHPLERTFHIFNRGPLTGFAHVSIDFLGLMMPRLSDAFELNPTCMLIPAGQSAAVNVVFRPRREDAKKIIKNIQEVLTLANMRIICGDEANRQRMRHLSQRLTADERAKIFPTTFDKLWHTFPNEVQVANFDGFNEQPDVIIDLFSCMRILEIALTINRNGIDDTIVSTSLDYPDADDTVLFRTICAASPVPNINQLEPIEEALETTNSVASSRWSVQPSILEFVFSANRKSFGRVSLLIRNFYKSKQHFEVACNRKNLLSMTPSIGNVAPDGGQVLIEVRPLNESRLMRECSMEADLSLIVYMKNERITVPVKVYK